MTKQSLVDDFTGLYPLSKVLKFELRPVGKTDDHIRSNGILESDFERADDYTRIKKIMDRYHRHFIDEALKETQLEGLDGYYRLYMMPKRTAKEEEQFKDIKGLLRKQISERFTLNAQYKKLFGKELIKEILPEYVQGEVQEQELVKKFEDFTTYFTGYDRNRKNMYSSEEKTTAIAYRTIEQNLPKYIDNMKIFSMIQKLGIVEKIPELEQALRAKIDVYPLERYFTLEGFRYVLSQSGIEIYNMIIGGYVSDDGVKIQGLNEYINLYAQKNKEKLPKFKPLFKQILSDREKMSFIPEQFHSDMEVIDSIRSLYDRFDQNVLRCKDGIDIEKLLSDLSSYELDKIYLKNDASMSIISNDIFGDRSYISDAIEAYYDEKSNEKRKNTLKYIEKRKKELSDIKYYSIKDLNILIESVRGNPCHVEEYFEKKVMDMIRDIYVSYEACTPLHDTKVLETKSLTKDKKAISDIKCLLDSMKGLQRSIKPLIIETEESDKDEVFYGELLRIWEEFDALTLLYNKVRDYVTKKPYSLEKIKLNFSRSTLLDGWDKNKEQANLGIILEKEGLYYLGIMDREYNKMFEDVPRSEIGSGYSKMEYKLLPGPNKMLPKVFFSRARIREFAPSDRLQEHYKQGTHKKGANFNLEDCHELIDFFKASIKKHEDWAQFDFDFSDTATYKDIGGFYKEVEHQGYKLTFRSIAEDYIDKMVEDGKLYLFQIYNKDFSTYSKGTPSLHTLYWKMLFDPENLKDVVYKLNGQAEVFYRKASIKPEDVIEHRAGQFISNRHPVNGKTKSVFSYDLIKDKRFTCDKYQFHVSITLNFKAEDGGRLNQRVNRVLHDADDIHIIGVDRGERNLLYLCCIDMNGNIIDQISLNKIISEDGKKNLHEKDYHELLKTREEENRKARKSWQTVNSIKELKEGYLSQVIHIITQWIVKYNAIVVLEDLNFGFIRSRQKFERQVYQKFEKMLIDKLNYLVDKNKAPDKAGGLLHAYQLTEKFESFQKMGKQSGFLFYIPAWNTSKLDPTTGFVDLFHVKYESIEKTQEFIKKFETIVYDPDKNYFKFSFDYSKFTYRAEGTRLKWTACTHGERIEKYRDVEKNNAWCTKKVDLTDKMKKLLDEYDIPILCGDLREQMIKIDKADFYKRFMKLFALLMQMRNSDTHEDKLISPIVNKHGVFFETGIDKDKPLDADANGAYNIARKGLWVIEQIKNADIEKLDRIKLSISNKEWLQYAQEHTL